MLIYYATIKERLKFCEKFTAKVRKFFKKKEKLRFVTIMPPELSCLTIAETQKFLYEVFGKFTFVAAIELGNIDSKKFAHRNFLYNYHIHLVIREFDYRKIRKKLEAMYDVKDSEVNRVWTIGWYLSKEVHYWKLDPQLNYPDKKRKERKKQKEEAHSKREVGFSLPLTNILKVKTRWYLVRSIITQLSLLRKHLYKKMMMQLSEKVNCILKRKTKKIIPSKTELVEHPPFYPNAPGYLFFFSRNKHYLL
jgi:hypothetical protein